MWGYSRQPDINTMKSAYGINRKPRTLRYDVIGL